MSLFLFTSAMLFVVVLVLTARLLDRWVAAAWLVGAAALAVLGLRADFYAQPARAFTHGFAVSVSNAPMQSLQLWGGGLVAHQNWALNTGVHFQAPDGAGAYIVGNDGIWHQLITDRSFGAPAQGGLGVGANCDTPSFNNAGSCWGVYPTSGTGQQYQTNNNGVVSICGSPADSTRAFMYAGGWVFRSDNIGVSAPDSITWRNVNQLGNTSSWAATTDNQNLSNRINGDFIACDPANKDHVIVGTQNRVGSTGMRESYDGGQHFTQVSSTVLPDSTNTNNYVMAFDPTSGPCTVAGSANPVTCTFAVWTNGTTGSGAGIYVTVDGNTADLALTGTSPATIQHLVFGANHTLFAVTGAVSGANPPSSGAPLKKYAVTNPLSGNWVSSASLTLANVRWLAIDPNNTNHMVAMDNGANLYVTTTGDSGWSNIAVTRNAPAGGDSPWLATIAADTAPVGYNIEFDPLNTGNLEAAFGQGTWTTTFGTVSGGAFTYTSHNKGVMHPVGFSQVVPKPLTVLQGLQDITGATTTIGSLPTVHPLGILKNLAFAAGVGVSVTDPNFTVERVSPNLAPGSGYDGTSTDNFTSMTNFVPVNNWYAQFPASAVSSSGGFAKVNLTGTGYSISGLKVWAQGDTSTAISILCAMPAGTTSTGAGNAFNSTGVCYTVTAVDAINNTLTLSASATNLSSYSGSYKLWSPTLADSLGVTNSVGGGLLGVTNVQNNGGNIQVSVFDASSSKLTVGAFVDLTNVTMTGGTTPVNGRYLVASKPTNTTVILSGSSSTGIGTYSSGGQLATWPEAGGTVAVASDTNFVIAPSNLSEPFCTNDGGNSFTPVTNAAIPASGGGVVTGGPYSAGATSITISGTVPGSTTVYIPMDNGWLFTSAATFATGTLTLSTPIPVNRQILAGAGVATTSGWPPNAFNASINIAADWVTPNTFYAAVTGTGLLKWTNCGATSIVNANNEGWLALPNGSYTLKAVPGNAGHLFFTTGPQGTVLGISSNGLWRSCNGGANFERVNGFFAPARIGFGHAKSGSSYPAIYVYGFYDPGNVEANAVNGLWRSTDDPNAGDTGTCAGGSGTWQKLFDWPSAFPNGPKWMALPTALDGDPGFFGPIYYQTIDGGFYGSFNYLLKRDLDPAANDNSPVGLAMVG